MPAPNSSRRHAHGSRRPKTHRTGHGQSGRDAAAAPPAAPVEAAPETEPCLGSSPEGPGVTRPESSTVASEAEPATGGAHGAGAGDAAPATSTKSAAASPAAAPAPAAPSAPGSPLTRAVGEAQVAIENVMTSVASYAERYRPEGLDTYLAPAMRAVESAVDELRRHGSALRGAAEARASTTLEAVKDTPALVAVAGALERGREALQGLSEKAAAYDAHYGVSATLTTSMQATRTKATSALASASSVVEARIAGAHATATSTVAMAREQITTVVAAATEAAAASYSEAGACAAATASATDRKAATEEEEEDDEGDDKAPAAGAGAGAGAMAVSLAAAAGAHTGAAAAKAAAAVSAARGALDDVAARLRALDKEHGISAGAEATLVRVTGVDAKRLAEARDHASGLVAASLQRVRDVSAELVGHAKQLAASPAAMVEGEGERERLAELALAAVSRARLALGDITGAARATVASAADKSSALASPAQAKVLAAYNAARDHATAALTEATARLEGVRGRVTQMSVAAAQAATGVAVRQAAALDARFDVAGKVLALEGRYAVTARAKNAAEAATAKAQEVDARFQVRERATTALGRLEGLDARVLGGRGKAWGAWGLGMATWGIAQSVQIARGVQNDYNQARADLEGAPAEAAPEPAAAH